MSVCYRDVDERLEHTLTHLASFSCFSSLRACTNACEFKGQKSARGGESGNDPLLRLVLIAGIELIAKICTRQN